MKMNIIPVFAAAASIVLAAGCHHRHHEHDYTVPGRRAMIIMIVTAGITGGQGRFPSRARIT